MERSQNGLENSSTKWIEGFKRNDQKVVQEFYALHFSAVRKYVLQNSGSNDDAQDIFQEALLATWLNLKEGRLEHNANTNIGGYVFRIAKNKWLDRVRSLEFKQKSNVLTTEAESIEENGTDVEARLEHLQTIYAQLDGRCKKVLDMFYYEKKNLESIASEMEVDIGSIRTIKYRCMMKLRKYHVELEQIEE